MIDRLEIVLQPSTRVAAPEMTLSPADEMGPGSIMSPEMTGKESEREHELKFENEEYPLLDPPMEGVVVGLKFGLAEGALGSLLYADVPYKGWSPEVIIN